MEKEKLLQDWQVESEYWFTFNHPKIPGVDFGMAYLSESNLEESLKLVVDLFSKSEPKYVHLKISRDDIYKLMRQVALRSIDDGFGVVCKDVIKNKVISVCLWTDAYNNRTNPLKLEELFSDDNPIRDIMGLWTDFKDVTKATGPKEALMMDFAVTSPEYNGTYIGTTLAVNIFFSMHSKLNLRYVYTIAGNKITSIASKRGKGVLVASVDIKNYKNSKGVKVFEGLEETTKKLNTLPFDKVEFWEFETASAHVSPNL
jgi:hypothetical protein